MKLAIDLDDVCFDFMAGFAQIFGKPPHPEMETVPGMYPQLPVEQIHATFNTDDVYWRAQPIPFAALTLHSFMEIGPIHYVSARPTHLTDLSRVLLKANGFPNPGNIFCLGSKVAKIQFLCTSGFDILVDDNCRIVQSVSRIVKFPYIFSRPWNLYLPWKFRLFGWREFAERLQ